MVSENVMQTGWCHSLYHSLHLRAQALLSLHRSKVLWKWAEKSCGVPSLFATRLVPVLVYLWLTSHSLLYLYCILMWLYSAPEKIIDVATRGGVNHELNGSDWVHWGTNLYPNRQRRYHMCRISWAPCPFPMITCYKLVVSNCLEISPNLTCSKLRI